MKKKTFFILYLSFGLFCYLGIFYLQNKEYQRVDADYARYTKYFIEQKKIDSIDTIHINPGVISKSNLNMQLICSSKDTFHINAGAISGDQVVCLPNIKDAFPYSMVLAFPFSIFFCALFIFLNRTLKFKV